MVDAAILRPIIPRPTLYESRTSAVRAPVPLCCGARGALEEARLVSPGSLGC